MSDIICELISTIKIVARDKLRHSEELSKCCDNILKLSKFAKSKYRYNRNLFKPEQKMMYDSVLQLNKVRTSGGKAVFVLPFISRKGSILIGFRQRPDTTLQSMTWRARREKASAGT